MTDTEQHALDIRRSPEKFQRGGYFILDVLIVLLTLVAYLTPFILRVVDTIDLPCYFIYNLKDDALPNCFDCYGNLLGEYFVTPTNNFEVNLAFTIYQAGSCYVFFVFFFIVAPTMIPNIITTDWSNYLSLWSILYLWIFTFFLSVLAVFASETIQIWFMLLLQGCVHVCSDMILTCIGFISLGHWMGLYEDVKLDSLASIRFRMGLVIVLFLAPLVFTCIVSNDVDIAWEGHLWVVFVLHSSVAHLGLPLNYLYAMHGPNSTLKSAFHDKLPWPTLFAIFVIHPIQGFGGAVQSWIGEQTCESNGFVEKGFFFLSTLIISYGVHCHGAKLLKKRGSIENADIYIVKEPTERELSAGGTKYLQDCNHDGNESITKNENLEVYWS